MKPGDLLQATISTNILLICESVDLHHAFGNCFALTDRQGVIHQTQPLAIQLLFAQQGMVYNPIQWGGAECNKILGSNPLPQWALNMVKTPAGFPATSQQPLAKKKYPLGAFITGSKVGNIWIVNADNSRDISLVWSGKQAKFMGSPTDREDSLKNDYPIATMQEVLDRISDQVGSKVAEHDLPRWALDFFNGRPFKAGGPQGIDQYKATVDQKVLDRLADNGISHKKIVEPTPKRPLDTFQESCNHRFLPYHGFREVYEFCVNCDKKRAVPK